MNRSIYLEYNNGNLLVFCPSIGGLTRVCQLINEMIEKGNIYSMSANLNVEECDMMRTSSAVQWFHNGTNYDTIKITIADNAKKTFSDHMFCL